MRLAELTMLQPFMFLQLVWASLLGLVAFGEVPDVWTWVGGAVVVGAATYIARREERRLRAGQRRLVQCAPTDREEPSCRP